MLQKIKNTIMHNKLIFLLIAIGFVIDVFQHWWLTAILQIIAFAFLIFLFNINDEAEEECKKN